eukprot:UN08547
MYTLIQFYNYTCFIIILHRTIYTYCYYKFIHPPNVFKTNNSIFDFVLLQVKSKYYQITNL